MTSTVSENRVSWTWAEQLGTYRFWGLLLFSILSSLGGGIANIFLGVFLRNELDLPLSTMEVLSWAILLGRLPGLYVAWVASRWRTRDLLALAGVLQLVGTLLLLVPGATVPLSVRYVGGALFGAGASVVNLGVLAVLAGGRGGMQAFVVAFGLISTLQASLNLVSPYLFANVIDHFGFSSILRVGLGLELLGLLALLPVKPSLFTGPPPARDVALPPAYRSPALVLLKCLVPFYWLYWFYRVHGEAMSIAPSRRLLSPGGAVAVALVPLLLPVGLLAWYLDWVALSGAIAIALIPFASPIVMTTLVEVLNERALAQARPRFWPLWVVFLTSLFCLPVAIALVQSAMNRIAAASE